VRISEIGGASLPDQKRRRSSRQVNDSNTDTGRSVSMDSAGAARTFHLRRNAMSDRHINSTSDDRVVNNVMRHEYRVLTDLEKRHMSQLKNMGLAFVDLCDRIGANRELSLAETKMEEAVMWSVKHVTK
jgi:hypothetical protein